MSKTSFARTPGKKNYVGKLIFPLSEEVQDVFFHKSGKMYKFDMHWNGEYIDSVLLTSKQIELFESMGYTFKKIELKQNKKASNKKFENIPIYARVESNEIQVSYHARDLIEVAARGKYILNKVKEFTDVDGYGSIYRKIERC